MNLDSLSPVASDPQALVRNVADNAGWEVRQLDDSWEVDVPVGDLRRQVVRVRFDRKDHDGAGLICFSTTCGPATEENAMSLLRYNAQMAHGAFGVETTDSGELAVIQANQLADTADVLEVTRAITALAWQADQVEEKLLGEDRH